MFKKLIAIFISTFIVITSGALYADEIASSSMSAATSGDSVQPKEAVATTSAVVSTKIVKNIVAKCGTATKCAAVATNKTSVDLSKLPCEIPKASLLKRGVSDGASYSVTKLQTALVKAGYLSATPNGYFGPATYAAVRKLQTENGLLVTGIVGPYSLAKVNTLLCAADSETKVTAPGMVSSEKKTQEGLVPDVGAIKPLISSFFIKTNTDGVQTYDAYIANTDSVSIKAECPSSVVEVAALVGLTKQKIDENDSVCVKEKYLYTGDISGQGVFERKNAPLIFVGRDAVSSWFALDAGATAYSSLPYTVKACKQNVCVQKKLSVEVRDFFQKVASTQLSIDSFMVDSTKKSFSVKASNFSHLTIKPGCPYTVQAVDQSGVALSDESGPCNLEKDIIANSTNITQTYDKSDEKLSTYGFNFILKPVDGSYDNYATVELTLKACTGVQAESVSSTTLRCVEKKGFMTVKDKIFVQATTTAQ